MFTEEDIPMRHSLPKALTLPQLQLVQTVKSEMGDIAAASLETVLEQGSKAKRFHCLSDIEVSLIGDYADAHNVELPKLSG